MVKNKLKIQCSYLTKVLLNMKSKPDLKDVVLRYVFWTNTWNHKIYVETFWIIREIKKLEFVFSPWKDWHLYLMSKGSPCHWCHRRIGLTTRLNKAREEGRLNEPNSFCKDQAVWYFYCLWPCLYGSSFGSI